MKIFRLFIFLAFCLTSQISYAQYSNPVGKIEREFDAAITFLSDKFDDYNRPFIKFFTIYNIPDDVVVRISLPGSKKLEELSLKATIEVELNFTIHSLSSRALNRPVELVPGSKTLYWIDIRDYGWTPEAFDQVSQIDPYFFEPVIPFEKAITLQALTATDKFTPKGYPILRADWFIVYSQDNTLQTDIIPNETPIQYILLYAQDTKTIVNGKEKVLKGVPKNVTEFQQRWLVDQKQLELIGDIIKGAAVDKGDSIVANNNRQISRVRTALGYYWETSDVKNNVLDRDFIENPKVNVISRNRDAGEMITTNKLGLQVYFLTDGQGNRVEFADPTVARDRFADDVRVRMMRSCVVCHAAGLNKIENAIAVRAGSKYHLLKSQDKEEVNKFEAFYLQQINKYVTEDSELYADAVFNITGYLPEQNMQLYKAVFDWYEQELDLEQAARESGFSKDYFTRRISVTTRGRLVDLVGELTVPRYIWDSRFAGPFQEAMLLVQREGYVYAVINADNVKLHDGPKVIKILSHGESYRIVGQRGNWYRLKVGSTYGWCHKDNIKVAE